MEDNVLLSLAALNDFIGASLELVANLPDEGNDERGNEAEDENSKLLLQLLNNLRQNGDLLESIRNALHDIVMEFNGGHDLLESLLDVESELLRLSGRDGHVLHLGSRGIVLKLIDLITLMLISKNAVGDLVKQISEQASVRLASLLKGTLKLLNFILSELVRNCEHLLVTGEDELVFEWRLTFTGHGMKEINATKRSSDDGVNGATSPLDFKLCITTNVGENIALAQLNQGQLAVVAVGVVICLKVRQLLGSSELSLVLSWSVARGQCSLTFKTVKSGSHETESLVQILLVSIVVSVSASKLDAALEKLPAMLSRRHNTDTLVCNVVLHARLGINGKLCLLIDRATKSTIVLASVNVLGIVLGVIDVLLGAVAAKALRSDLELARSETEGHETQDAEQETDSLSRNSLDGSNIDSLGVITEPVTKVDSGNGHFVEFLAALDGAGHRDSEEGIFDIAVSPWMKLVSSGWKSAELSRTVLSLNLGNGSNISSSKGHSRRG